MNRQQEREMYQMLCELVDALDDPASRNQMQRDDLVARGKRLRGLAQGWLAKPHALQAQRDALLAACEELSAWPLHSTNADGRKARDAGQSLANARRFAGAAIAQAQVQP